MSYKFMLIIIFYNDVTLISLFISFTIKKEASLAKSSNVSYVIDSPSQ